MKPFRITGAAEVAAMPGDALRFSRPPQADRIAALFHTDGTTGVPKLAQHTHGNQLHAAWGAARATGALCGAMR